MNYKWPFEYKPQLLKAQSYKWYSKISYSMRKQCICLWAWQHGTSMTNRFETMNMVMSKLRGCYQHSNHCHQQSRGCSLSLELSCQRGIRLLNGKLGFFGRMKHSGSLKHNNVKPQHVKIGNIYIIYIYIVYTYNIYIYIFPHGVFSIAMWFCNYGRVLVKKKNMLDFAGRMRCRRLKMKYYLHVLRTQQHYIHESLHSGNWT